MVTKKIQFDVLRFQVWFHLTLAIVFKQLRTIYLVFARKRFIENISDTSILHLDQFCTKYEQGGVKLKRIYFGHGISFFFLQFSWGLIGFQDLFLKLRGATEFKRLEYDINSSLHFGHFCKFLILGLVLHNVSHMYYFVSY